MDKTKKPENDTLGTLLAEMKLVAEGDSAVALRTKLREVFPKDKDTARKLYNSLVRLKDVVEMTVNGATEEMAILEQ